VDSSATATLRASKRAVNGTPASAPAADVSGAE